MRPQQLTPSPFALHVRPQPLSDELHLKTTWCQAEWFTTSQVSASVFSPLASGSTRSGGSARPSSCRVTSLMDGAECGLPDLGDIGRTWCLMDGGRTRGRARK